MVPMPYSRDIERKLMHRELREHYARNGMDRPPRYPIASFGDVSPALIKVHLQRQITALTQVPSMIMNSTAVTAGELAEIQAALDQYYPGTAATSRNKGNRGMVPHRDFQTALDAALAQSRDGVTTRIDLDRYTGSATVPAYTLSPPAKAHVHCKAAGCMPEKAELPGVHLLEKKRVGRETRDIYLEQLRRAYSEEYIDPAEMDARQDAMMSAATEDELKLLVRDLEPLKEDKPVLTGKHPRQAVLYFILTIISTCFPIMAAAGILAGGNVITVSVLALIGGFAAIGTRACVSDA